MNLHQGRLEIGLTKGRFIGAPSRGGGGEEEEGGTAFRDYRPDHRACLAC
jgi:hypothetical protein